MIRLTLLSSLRSQRITEEGSVLTIDTKPPMQTQHTLSLFAGAHAPLVVCDGMGVDSTAMLAGMHQRKIRPDLIIHADVGAEREATYEYHAIKRDWLKRVGFPDLTVVRYQPKNFKHWPHYHTIEENILTNVSLPSIAYGGHTCSAKWKIAPINTHVLGWTPAQECWSAGGKVLKAIGFEDSPHEQRRACKGSATFALQADESSRYELWFPLQQWGWNRERCSLEILRAGLPVPPKSSCYFCTAMKPWEVEELSEDKLKRIVILEARTAQRHLDHARAKAEQAGERWDGKPRTEGLWRKAVKGMRGATPKPGSMTQYIREKRLLPAEEVDRLISSTPTHTFTRDDFAQMGITNWQEWIQRITTTPAQEGSVLTIDTPTSA